MEDVPKVRITVHYNGHFEGDPLMYLPYLEKQIGELDLAAMSYYECKVHIENLCGYKCDALYYVVPGMSLDNGLRAFRNRFDMDRCTWYAIRTNQEIHFYMDHYDSDLRDILAKKDDDCEYLEAESIGQNVVESDSDDDIDRPAYHYTDDEDDTASLDHLSEGEEEVVEVRRNRPTIPANVADDDFLSQVCDSYYRDKVVEKDYDSIDERPIGEDNDILDDNLPIHNPHTKWNKIHPVIGEKFASPQQLKKAVIFYALANGYRLYFKRNSSKKLCVKCCKDVKGEEGCKYHLWASYMQNEQTFQIKTLVDEHTCSRSFEFGGLINCNWIASVYGKNIIRNPKIKLREIKEKMMKKYKCSVTLNQCKRAKQKALDGLETCLEAHYAKLWAYANEIVKTNPGSTCKIRVNTTPDEKRYFEGFYVCFKGLRDGWLAGCRKVIGLDGCFLKTICKGELLSAVGRDANNQIYPVAWAVVTVENKENWMWFMQLLIYDLGLEGGRGLCIISDMHKGLLQAANEVMPLAEHRQCARHIYASFRKKFTGVHFRNLFWKASKATYMAKFEETMLEIKSSSPAAHKYLMDKEPKTWSRTFFPTDTVCDVVENGISECFNSVLFEAKAKPLITMLEDIRKYLMDRMDELRIKHSKWHDVPCPNIIKKFEFFHARHGNWACKYGGDGQYEVTHGNEGFIVDPHNKTCSCRAWQLSGIPCAHACSTIYMLNLPPSRFISEWLTKDMCIKEYSYYIKPLQGIKQWEDPGYEAVLPPRARRVSGRPKKNRRRDGFEASEGTHSNNRAKLSKVGVAMTCQLCFQKGHNSRGCPNPHIDTRTKRKLDLGSQVVPNQHVSVPMPQMSGLNPQMSASNPLTSAPTPLMSAPMPQLFTVGRSGTFARGGRVERGGRVQIGGKVERGSRVERVGRVERGGMTERGGRVERGGRGARGGRGVYGARGSRGGRGGFVPPRGIGNIGNLINEEDEAQPIPLQVKQPNNDELQPLQHEVNQEKMEVSGTQHSMNQSPTLMVFDENVMF